ncbi:hypothetical protein C2845_PM08G15390 [Panicum miliaceum]|uniref:Uncharacterized protein n=1 Tax=Panicum miliaceum TaxID=4540 RepID=A0A3L6R1I7_PANMI|nr:hypothetical protein C2845_PM08G15390 [Panicum miliaceum]
MCATNSSRSQYAITLKMKKDLEDITPSTCYAYEDRAAHMVLKEELVVALTLGGARSACTGSYPAVLRVVVGGAGSRVDAALVSALQDKGLSVIERLELRAIRTYVYGEMWSVLKGLKP